MAAGVLIPLEEYQSTTYEPDMDYDDGVLIERNVGQHNHSRMTFGLTVCLGEHEQNWGIRGYVEQRIRIGPRRFVVADICAARASAPIEQTLITPPLFVIEILSPEDKFYDVDRKAQEYLAMGISYVWTVDPETGRSWRHYPQIGFTPIADSILRIDDTPIEIHVIDLWKKI